MSGFNRVSTAGQPGADRPQPGPVVEAELAPGEVQQALFAIGAYVIGSATEWHAEAERSATTPAQTGDELTELREEVLAGHPVLLAALTEVLPQPPAATFELGLDLLVEGLRARHASGSAERPS